MDRATKKRVISNGKQWNGYNEKITQTESNGITTLTNEISISGPDAAVIMSEARYKSMRTGGWSKDRNHREIGKVLLPDFLAMRQKAQEEGRVLGRKDFEAYFAQKPALRVINNSKPGIIIK